MAGKKSRRKPGNVSGCWGCDLWKAVYHVMKP